MCTSFFYVSPLFLFIRQESGILMRVSSEMFPVRRSKRSIPPALREHRTKRQQQERRLWHPSLAEIRYNFQIVLWAGL